MYTLEELKAQLKLAKKAYYMAFSQDIIKQVEAVKKKHWFDTDLEERVLIKKVSKHLKEIRHIQDKIDIIKLGATKRNLNKMRAANGAWDKKMADRKAKLERLRKYLDSSNKLFALDIEEHEFSRKLLEVGVSIYENNELKTHHFIVAEHLTKTNRKFVPNNKDKFLFGVSLILPLEEIKVKVKELYKGSTYIVGHSFKNDAKFLASCDCERIKVLDTQTYATFFFKKRENISLEEMAKRLKLNPKFLHNAGNDSHLTVQSLLSMAKEG